MADYGKKQSGFTVLKVSDNVQITLNWLPEKNDYSLNLSIDHIATYGYYWFKAFLGFTLRTKMLNVAPDPGWQPLFNKANEVAP